MPIQRKLVQHRSMLAQYCLGSWFRIAWARDASQGWRECLSVASVARLVQQARCSEGGQGTWGRCR
eukprot:SAG25_NODE_9310_length_378_cov_0.763441_1_plen_65_part_01